MPRAEAQPAKAEAAVAAQQRVTLLEQARVDTDGHLAEKMLVVLIGEHSAKAAARTIVEEQLLAALEQQLQAAVEAQQCMTQLEQARVDADGHLAELQHEHWERSEEAVAAARPETALLRAAGYGCRCTAAERYCSRVG